ncbi:hypothetical protein FLCU109888_03975 [Flavobacterium cucumis]|uniref:Uncharacterized protein n=1 Tax=Flavobacterium cucumis TaxID=416016 RepID=A0A1M7ZV44_9FLAO|nr:hypothetical protein [Flavobacterium cucumis]SHO72751.1 hypothetical protein SAMN05443547_1090 [Flavobacterium cucumis]
MTYLKFIQYIYIIFAGFFIYDAYMKFKNSEDYLLSLIIAGVAIGMFFFRRHFHNKYQNKQ